MSVYSAPEGGLARSARRLSAGRKAGAVTGDVQTASGRVKERDRDPVRSRGGVRLAAGAGGDQGRGRIFGSGPGGPGRGCSELPLDGAPGPAAALSVLQHTGRLGRLLQPGYEALHVVEHVVQDVLGARAGGCMGPLNPRPSSRPAPRPQSHRPRALGHT